MKPYFIGVAGPSCAGKSYLAGRLAEKLGAALLQLDSYYRELDHLAPHQRAQYNFDKPDALDSALLLAHARQLYNGETIARPVYDFATHTRTRETLALVPKTYVIVEGLFALYWESLRNLMGTKVFVDLGEEICLERRIMRDISERARTRESVLEQYRATVLPMARQFVYPTRAHADLAVTGNDDISHEVEIVLRHVERGVAMSIEGVS
jgi:uridine kinase